MSKAKYTPGPWEVVGGNVYTKLGAENRVGVKAHVTDGWCIAATNSCPCISSEGVDEDLSMPEFMANAHLIAAAPDLLEVLEMLESTCGEGWLNQDNPVRIYVRKVIAKAKD